MKYFTKTIEIKTSKPIQFVDITDQVRQLYEESGVANGVMQIFSNHTTASVRINERCSRLQDDMLEHLKSFAPREKAYKHNQTALDGRDNAHSHLMSLFFGSSESIPVADGKLNLGTWQSVFFVELDGPRNSRGVTVNIIGE